MSCQILLFIWVGTTFWWHAVKMFSMTHFQNDILTTCRWNIFYDIFINIVFWWDVLKNVFKNILSTCYTFWDNKMTPYYLGQHVLWKVGTTFLPNVGQEIFTCYCHIRAYWNDMSFRGSLAIWCDVDVSN